MRLMGGWTIYTNSFGLDFIKCLRRSPRGRANDTIRQLGGIARKWISLFALSGIIPPGIITAEAPVLWDCHRHLKKHPLIDDSNWPQRSRKSRFFVAFSHTSPTYLGATQNDSVSERGRNHFVSRNSFSLVSHLRITLLLASRGFSGGLKWAIKISGKSEKRVVNERKTWRSN